MSDIDLLPPGWRAITKVYGAESKIAGQTYVHYGHESGKPSSINSIRKVYELYCEANGLDFDTEWETYNKTKKDRAEFASEKNGNFNSSRSTELGAKFAEAFGKLQGPDVVEFKGWKTRFTHSPTSGQTSVFYTDPCGRNFKNLSALQAWLGFCMEHGLEDRVRALVESAKATADPVFFGESKKAAAQQEDNIYSFVRNPLKDGENGNMFESDSLPAKKARRDDENDIAMVNNLSDDNRRVVVRELEAPPSKKAKKAQQDAMKDIAANGDQQVQQPQEAENNVTFSDSERRVFNNPERRAELSQRFVEVFGKLRGWDVAEFKGWRTIFTHLPESGQCRVQYVDPSGRTFSLLNNLQAWLGFWMESGLEERVRTLVEPAKAGADAAWFANFRTQAVEGTSADVVKTPLDNGESAVLFEFEVRDMVAKDFSTDDELSAMPIPCEGPMEPGFSLRQCRQGRAYAVLPTDLIRIGDMRTLSERITAESGYRTEEISEEKRLFKGAQGDPEFVLFSTGGRLLVRTDKRTQAAKLAETYAGKWLWEGESNAPLDSSKKDAVCESEALAAKKTKKVQQDDAVKDTAIDDEHEVQRDIKKPTKQVSNSDLPPGWRTITKVYGPESAIAGQTYIRYIRDDGEKQVGRAYGSVKKVYEVYCEENGLDFFTEWERYTKDQKNKAELTAENNGNFTQARVAELGAKFTEAFGKLQGADVVEFRGWKTRFKLLPGGQYNVLYFDPGGRSFLHLASVQAWLGFCMENGLEDRVRELVETAKDTADPAAYTETKRLADEQEDLSYSFVKNPLEDGETGMMCESIEPSAKKQ